jgi:hypothetical protein
MNIHFGDQVAAVVVVTDASQSSTRDVCEVAFNLCPIQILLSDRTDKIRVVASFESLHLLFLHNRQVIFGRPDIPSITKYAELYN